MRIIFCVFVKDRVAIGDVGEVCLQVVRKGDGRGGTGGDGGGGDGGDGGGDGAGGYGIFM